MVRYLTLLILTALLSACVPQPPKASKSETEDSKTRALPIKGASAHWFSEKFIAVAPSFKETSEVTGLALITVDKNGQSTPYPMTKTDNLSSQISPLPHLSNFVIYQLNADDKSIKELLKRKLTVSNGKIATQVQTAAVLDQLYTSNDNDANEADNLGAVLLKDHITFNLWAPTASSVKVLLFNQDKSPYQTQSLAMTEDTNTGLWTVKGDSSLAGKYYQYQIDVYHPASQDFETLVTTDPYSLSLSTNSKYSHIIDLNSEKTMPEGWLAQRDNPVANPEDNIFYETHIRDFSASDSALSNPAFRGKYLAFTETESDGMKHLATLKEAGINSVHLLPAFDIGTVNEDTNTVISLDDSLQKACDLSENDLVCSLAKSNNTSKIGRASCRERVCMFV